jgi:hypothetical protein
LTRAADAVHNNSIEATVNAMLREWRDLWPGGLGEREYSTLNLMAQCRGGGLGCSRAKCGDCGAKECRPNSCGDRHCPVCLGPRQQPERPRSRRCGGAEWTCGRFFTGRRRLDRDGRPVTATAPESTGCSLGAARAAAPAASNKRMLTNPRPPAKGA